MLQHYFRQNNSTCLSSSPVNKILKILSVAICLVRLWLTPPWNRNQDKCLKCQHIFVSFLIERHKCDYHETSTSTDTIKYYILHVKCLLQISIYTNREARILVFVKKFNLRISALYLWRLVSFRILTALHRVSVNAMEKKWHNTKKSVRSNEVALLQADNYQIKHVY
jgi:hypothetical protein